MVMAVITKATIKGPISGSAAASDPLPNPTASAMKLSVFPFLACLTLTVASPVLAPAQEAPKTPVPAEQKPSAAPAKAPGAEELEAALVETLSNVLFKGEWCLIKDGKLGESKPEQYEIVGVMKTGGDRWVVNARIQYGKVNLVAPVPIQVKWAGDTPIMIVDKFSLPGAGTYSARVMIFEGTYSGTWTAGDHGGMLHGLIVKKPAP